MSGNYDNIVKPKRYIQFNDLVFSGVKSIGNQSESLSLRESKTSRTFSHGSYVANRGEVSYVSDNSISLEVALQTSKWGEDHVKAHYEFILQQLMTPGKLWAIQTGLQLVWANCYVTSIQPRNEWVITDDNYLVFNIELDNPDGVWYKANDLNIFLEPYDQCDFLEMKASCLGKDRFCCNANMNCSKACECCEGQCKSMCDMVGLCEMRSNVQFMNDFFDECNSKWRVVYNCEMAKLSGRRLADLYPHAICDTCVNDTLSGSFMSHTVLPSGKWNVAVMGDLKDPEFFLNDQQISVKGEYKGVFILSHTGEMKFARSWECIEYDYDTVDIANLKLCVSSPKVKAGRNNISVSGITSDTACIYVDYGALTL